MRSVRLTLYHFLVINNLRHHMTMMITTITTFNILRISRIHMILWLLKITLVSLMIQVHYQTFIPPLEEMTWYGARSGRNGYQWRCSTQNGIVMPKQNNIAKLYHLLVFKEILPKKREILMKKWLSSILLYSRIWVMGK